MVCAGPVSLIWTDKWCGTSIFCIYCVYCVVYFGHSEIKFAFVPKWYRGHFIATKRKVVCRQYRLSAKLGTFTNKTLNAYEWGERASIRIVRMVNMTLKVCSSLKLMAHTSIHIHQSRRGTSERRRWKGHLWQVKRCGLSLHLSLLCIHLTSSKHNFTYWC